MRSLSRISALSVSCCLIFASYAVALDDNALLSIFSDSQTTDQGNFSFSTTTETDLSGSNWGFRVDESPVYHAALKHQQAGSPTNRQWELRVGKGGQIYSIRSEVGEIVPPQSLGRPFVDEVFQSISVDTSLRDQGGEAAFYHQAGYYTDGDNVSQPSYAPLLASGAVDANSYSTLSLAVQADTNSNPQQPGGLLNYQRTRDLGDGVIEITHSIYNFGENTVDFHNLPWGGVRKTEFDNMLVSNPNGGFTDRAILGFGDFENQVELAENTGGWAAFTEGTSAADRGIAYVFGDTDTHIGEDWQTNRSSWRWGDGGGDIIGIPVRNFNVGTFRRFINVNPGDLFESRYFVVLGDVDHIQSTIDERDLVGDALYDKVSIREEDSEVLSYRVVDDGGSISVMETAVGQASDFGTYAKPVAGSQPMFLFEDASGRQFLSVDPYALSEFPYDGETVYKGLLGFVLPSDIAIGDGPYVDLNSVLPGDYYLDTNPNVTIFALQGTSAIPETSPLVLLIFGILHFALRRRKQLFKQLYHDRVRFVVR